MKGRNFSPSLYLSFVIQHFAKKTKEVKNKSVHICIGIQLIGLREGTLPTVEIISAENARAWVSMVLYLKK